MDGCNVTNRLVMHHHESGGRLQARREPGVIVISTRSLLISNGYVFLNSSPRRIIRTHSKRREKGEHKCPTSKQSRSAKLKLRSSTVRRAQITQEYLSNIEKLEPGQAGRLQPTEGETVAAIRRRVGAAAKLSGKPVTIKRVGQEVFFWVTEREQGTRRRRRKSQ